MRARSACLAVLLAAAAGAALTACRSATGRAGGRVVVVATTTQLADFARHVGGERVEVRQLLKPGVDPHDYEPTPGDVETVSSAAVAVENGVGLDGWLDELVANADREPTRVVASEGVALRRGDGEDTAGDPHVWLDPRNAERMVRNVAAGLERADPEGASAYRANATRYLAQIAALDAELRARIATVPRDERKIVTDHDAFGYLAARYGIRVVGTVIPSLSTAAEPAARDLSRLAATITREGVRVVFAEHGVNPALQKAIAREARIMLGAPLYGDTLGPAGEPAGSYLGMMRANMDAIIAGMRA